MAIAKKKAPARTTRWTKARERVFLEHLALSSNVAASERVAKMPVGSAYKRRRVSAAFEQAWREALRDGYSRLEHALLDRALNGTPVVKIARDGTETRTIEYSDRLAMVLINAHRATVAATPATPGEGEAAKARLAAKLDLMAERLGNDA